jgi:rRNA maturation protein Nop10
MQIYTESMRCSECGCAMRHVESMEDAINPQHFYRHYKNGCSNSGKDVKYSLPNPMDPYYEALDSEILESARLPREPLV